MMAAQRLTDALPPATEPALCPFEVGKTYSKDDIYRIFEVPDKQQKGNWNTGYTKYAARWFIFSNINIPGRTGHDYGDRLRPGGMTWFGKTKSHIGQPSIVDMVSGKHPVYIFYRHEDRSPFTFGGMAHAVSVKDSTPVEVEWEFRSSPYAPLPLQIVVPRVAVVREPTPDTPSTPTIKDYPSIPPWIQGLLAHPRWHQAAVHAGRHRPSDTQVAHLLTAVDAAPGRQLSLTAAAQAIQVPPLRIAGIIAQVCRMLNLDGYQVLQITVDRGFVRLDKDLACRQFSQGSLS